MKKNYSYFLAILFLFSAALGTSQTLNIGTTPGWQCYSTSGNTAYAVVTSSAAGATNYSWTATSGTCSGVITATGNGATVTVSYPCCGVYTLSCSAYNSTISSSPVLLNTSVVTATVVCPPVISIGGPSVVCQNKSIVLSGSGVSSYTWLPGNQTTSNITVTPTSNTCYTLIGATSLGCKNSAIRCVTVNPSPTLSITGNSVVCAGTSNTYVASGANSYQWTSGTQTFSGSTIVLNPTASTCFSVTGYTSSGCIGTASTCVTVQQNTSFTVSGPSGVCVGKSATLTASGAAGYTWMPGNLNGSVVIVSPTANICYTVTSSNGGNCNGAITKCLYLYPNPNITVSGGVFCTGSTHTITANGAMSFTWLPSNTTGSTMVVTPTAGACYTVIGLTSAGCTGTASNCYSIGTAPSVSITGSSTTCAGSSISLYASGASSYTWLPSNSTNSVLTVTPTSNSCYTLVGGSGCNSSAVHCVTISPSSTVVVSGPAGVCLGASATLSVPANQSYTWMPGNLTGTSVVVSPTVSTCYTVTSSAGSGCSATSYKCLYIYGNPTVNVSGGTFCSGTTHTLTASGAMSFTWLPSNSTGSTMVVTPTVGACYTVVALTSAGCTGTATNCYSIGTAPSVSVTGSSTICAGTSTPLYASGATSYTWLPSNVTGSVINVNPTGNSCYTVVGGSGCNSSAVHCISVSPASSLSISGPNGVCAGKSATLTLPSSQTYTWMPGNLTGTSIVVTPTSNVCYTVSINGGTTCSSYAYKCISMYPNPVIGVSGGTFCSGTTHTLTASGAMSFTWLPSNTTGPSKIVTPTTSACYTVIGLTSAGCTGTASNCYSVNASPTIIAVGGTVCAGDKIILSASGAATYTWVPSYANTSTISVTPTNNICYSVYGKNALGCATVAAACVTVLPRPMISISGNTMVCLGTSANLFASGATSYTWSTSANTASINVLTSTNTNYSVTGTGTNGCHSFAVFAVNVNTACSDVWPGDANSDGVVSNIDVFEIGLAYNNTGTPRNPGGNNFIAQYSANWTGTISTGKNKCHADCNGDGTINSSDTIAIFNNYALTHSFKPGSSASNPEISLSPDNGFFVQGSWNQVDINLGDVSQPLSKLYGVAFDLNYDQQLIEPDSAYIVYTSSFLNSNNSNVLFRKYFPLNGKACAANVRMDGIDVSGYGKIGEFHFKAKSGLPSISVINLSLQDANKVSSAGIVAAISVGTSALTLRDDVSVAENKNSTNVVRLFPNPSNGLIKITGIEKGGSYVVSGISGTELKTGSLVEKEDIDLRSFESGIYIIRIKSSQHETYHKVVLNK